jgi:DNA invertase Pin-like site-specific DNA recombinase
MERSGFEFDEIFEDAESGKKYSRKNYDRLLSVLKAGDLLVVKHPDRLGRDYEEAKEQWRHIVREIGADIYILDYPMLDTREIKNDLVQTFICDNVLHLLFFKAAMEYEDSRQRQAEGIAEMPIVDGKRVSLKTCNPIGMPNRELNFEKFSKKKKDGLITVSDACRELGISRTQWYRLVKETA